MEDSAYIKPGCSALCDSIVNEPCSKALLALIMALEGCPGTQYNSVFKEHGPPFRLRSKSLEFVLPC